MAVIFPCFVAGGDIPEVVLVIWWSDLRCDDGTIFPFLMGL
ncbi:hypothetical protein [Pectobacterium aroidearum]|nr:hypothetical protein [Pectobacterium aroidearum]